METSFHRQTYYIMNDMSYHRKNSQNIYDSISTANSTKYKRRRPTK